MKVDRRIPLIHPERLVAAIIKANCFGLLAFAGYMRKEFRARKSQNAPRPFFETKEPSIEEAPADVVEAFQQLANIIDARYNEREKQIEAAFVDWDGDDCTAHMRTFLYTLEVVPTLPEDLRMKIDQIYGDAVRRLTSGDDKEDPFYSERVTRLPQ